MPKVFYSWQSDLGPAHRQFQAQLVDEACARASTATGIPLVVTNADRQRTGSPRLDDLLDEAIALSSVFVCDVSLTGKSLNADSGPEKLFPNSNVAIELGMARSSLGAESIVLVMETSTGRPERLPSDIAAFVPCTYDQRTCEQSDDALHALVRALQVEIEKSLFGRALSGLSPALRLVAYPVISWFCGPGSTVDGRNFRLVSPKELAELLDLDPGEVHQVCKQLAWELCLDERGGAGSIAFRGNHEVLRRFDQLCGIGNPGADARAVACALLRRGGTALSSEIAGDLGWHPRRLNPALTQLELWSAVGLSGAVEPDSPFRAREIFDTEFGQLTLASEGQLKVRSRLVQD